MSKCFLALCLKAAQTCQAVGSSSTFFWTAARLWTTRAADVAAALLRAALTATDAEEHDEQESTEDDQQDCQPVCSRTEDTSLRLYLSALVHDSPQSQRRENLRYTMSLISRSESPVVSPGASMEQKYTPLSHHITSLMIRSASVDRKRHIKHYLIIN